MTTLSDLITRVEGASGADRELDALIAAQFKIIAARLYGLADGYTYDFRVSDDLVNVEVWESCGDGNDNRQLRRAPSPYTASVDAALSLLERVLPGWTWSIGNLRVGAQAYLMRAPGARMFEGKAPSPALALVLAILKAKAERS